jgi:hypothetical protein
VYGPVREAAVLEQHGETFRVLIRLHKSNGPVSAVLDVWSVVLYQQACDDCDLQRVRVSVSPRWRMQPAERAASTTRSRPGYLWRTSTFHASPMGCWCAGGLENLGLSRSFPPLLGWIIEPIARRIGRSSVKTRKWSSNGRRRAHHTPATAFTIIAAFPDFGGLAAAHALGSSGGRRRRESS